MFNLLKGVRDALFPAIMFALMAFAVLVTSAKADVMNPNGVPMSASDWAETSPDAAKVTVKDALSNSDNSQIVDAVNGGPLTLDLEGADSSGTIWWPGDAAEIKMTVISKSGSVLEQCVVSSAKGSDGKFETTCTKD